MDGRRRRCAIYLGTAIGASAALAGAIVLPLTTQPAPDAATSAAPAAQPASTPVVLAIASLPRAEPAPAKMLKALLPEAVATLKSIDSEAGVRSLGEMRSSFARATYAIESKPEAGSAVVKIVDYIGMPGLFESAAPWASLDIETETDAEYSRTFMLGTHKAMETYVKQTRTGSINVLVAGRFVVTVEVASLPPDSLRQTASMLKLDELGALAK